ncbi:MAG: homocysteine S-methyltransferase family protein [Lachnospiraceae bacterium]|jgi:5-methyltetrahydrofolate--homocysteine methyltransferase
MTRLSDKLGKEWLFFDGGIGSLLQQRGLKAGDLSDNWNLTRPEEIIDIHSAYLRAGCNIITTNTFSSNRFKFKEGLSDRINAAVSNAREACRRTCRDDAFIALDIGPTGKLLEPMGDLAFEDAVSAFAEIINIGKGGADLILIETMSDIYEAKAAVIAAKENCDLPVIVTLSYDANGRLLTGGTVDSSIATLEGLGVDALGFNCGLGPDLLLPLVRHAVSISSLPVVVQPNAGLPHTVNGVPQYDIGPEKYAGLMTEIAGLGVHVLGGCCGTTPDHIKKMITACSGMNFIPPVKKNISAVTSYSECVKIGARPVVIGERINPTGKSKLKAALRENNIEYLLGEAIKQEDAGADILDVNVGLPEIDEPEMMKNAVMSIQSISSLPLQLDSSDPVTLEKAMRIYNGKPMINSVNGKSETMEAVFPLVKKYGGLVVGLALDENGIPETASERFRIAERIYRTAEKYGIDKKDIIIDGLAMTISSNQSSAKCALDTLKMVHEKLDGHTILGVSNISFGLPKRDIINSHFLTMALYEHLSAAIINPCNDGMMNSVRAFNALMEHDSKCLEYIEACSAKDDVPKKEAASPSSDEPDLQKCIISGMKDNSVQSVKRLLESGTDPMSIINEVLIPALDIVGKNYESGKIYLPQLLMSADAAKEAFSILKENMSSESSEGKGRVLIATVKDDVHDIGKNIVKVLLENYGFDVYDLGKDVPPEKIVSFAKENNIKLVALSALMTTTVKNMEDTIKMLHEQLPDVKTVVGGAVLTRTYAEQIGADCYSKDGMDTVRYAEKVLSGA